jgi:P pilus assembly chaperone PapD
MKRMRKFDNDRWHPALSSTRPRRSMRGSLLFLILLSLFLGSASAQNLGDLLVTPTRIIFEGSKRNENITLVNSGTDTATYAISFLQYRMNDAGSLEEIEQAEPGQLFADKLLRYFPRQVTLAPQESQAIRLQLVKPADLADGEYRSHIYFRAVPKPKQLEDLAEDTSSGLQVRLTAVYGISIPAIVRQGKQTVNLTLDSVRVVPSKESGTQELQLRINRSGNSSLYGDVTVTMSRNGRTDVVGEAKGVALYTPNSTRSFALPLTAPDGGRIERCTLSIQFSSRSDLKDRVETTAELTLP